MDLISVVQRDHEDVDHALSAMLNPETLAVELPGEDLQVAVQRADVGLVAGQGGAEDSFWSWRQVMYGFVDRLTPQQVESIAAQLQEVSV